MSSRTYICISCRTSRRAEAAYGLNTNLRCSQCGGRLWELEWRWRIPRKNDDKGWRVLEAKVAHDAREWLPRRRSIGQTKLQEIDRQIESAQKQKPSPSRERCLRLLSPSAAPLNGISPNQTVQRIGASRFAQGEIEHQRRLAPIADLYVRTHDII